MNAVRKPNLFLIKALSVVMLISVPLYIWQIAFTDLDEATAMLYTRYTARVSFLFFLPVFLAKPLNVLWPSVQTARLLKNRRDLGLAFALAHMIHMGAIILLYQVQGRWFTAEDGAALSIYAMLGFMVITSNKLSAQKLGILWRWGHKVGIYALFTGFFVTYLTRTLEYDAAVANGAIHEYFAMYVLLLLLVSLAWALRITAFWRGRI